MAEQFAITTLQGKLAPLQINVQKKNNQESVNSALIH
jgi:hypothetical protein